MCAIIGDLASVWQRSGGRCDKDRGIGARRDPAACLFHKSGLTHHAPSEGNVRVTVICSVWFLLFLQYLLVVGCVRCHEACG